MIVGDASGGGTGGSTDVLTAGESNDTSCLEEGYQLANSNYQLRLPVSGKVAAFEDLPGAVDLDGKPVRNKSSSRGNLIGGVIGGAIAAGVLLVLLVVFLLYRRKKIKARDEARKEENRFMDLDGDEDGNAELGSIGREMSQT